MLSSRLGLAAAAAVGLFHAPLSAQQAVWSQGYPKVSPPARHSHAITYDSARQRAVLFGGRALGPQLGDTWEWRWDAARGEWNWESIPVAAPTPRSQHAMAYHEATGETILYGGGGQFTDTWSWNGTTWRQLSPSKNPGTRQDHAMAYDSARGEILLYGGRNTETWVWDGTAWLLRSPANNPRRRSRLGMAYDRARGRVVLFGGGTTGTGLATDTWEWDGTDWMQRFPRNSPSAGQYRLVYDEARRRVVALAEASSGIVFHWEWDGTNWSIVLTSPPPSRTDHAMTYVGACGRVLLFGGFVTGVAADDTWEYYLSSPAQVLSLGGGCAGSMGVPRLAPAAGQLPWLCSTPFVLELSSLPTGAANFPFGVIGLSKTLWGGFPLPVELGVIGMPGCHLASSIEALVPLVNQGGTATMTLRFPLSTGLVGLSLYAQGMVVDPPANPLGIVLSDGAELVLGQQ